MMSVRVVFNQQWAETYPDVAGFNIDGDGDLTLTDENDLTVALIARGEFVSVRYLPVDGDTAGR